MTVELKIVWIAVDLNRFHPNHGYWSEGVWVSNENEATLYNSSIKAENVAKRFARKPHWYSIQIAVPV